MRRLAISQPETIHIGRFLLDSFTRDKADFIRLSPHFADPFGAGFLELINNVAELPAAKSANAELKMVTKRIHENMRVFRSDAATLNALILLADGTLTISKEDFGIGELRKTITGYKVPEFMSAMTVLLSNIRSNQPALTSVGLNAEFISELETRAKQVAEDDVLQNSLMSHRGQLVQDNEVMIGQLQQMMKLIMESGKALYKLSNPVRYKDYSINDLKRKHRTIVQPAPVSALT